MATAAFGWLAYEAWRLLLAPWESGPTDLMQRLGETQAWFAGERVYGVIFTAVYPPASYVMLWPLLGSASATAARWIWALTSLVALVWLVSLCVRESGARSSHHRVLVAMIPLSMYATGATIGNGQLLLHVLPLLLAALLLLAQEDPTWRRDAAAAALFLLALVKPTIAAPFFWIVLFVPGRVRPALMVGAGYVGLSWFAALFQDGSLAELMVAWLGRAERGVAWGARVSPTSEASWVDRWVLGGLGRTGSLAVIVALGLWTLWYRRASLWMHLGVTAIVARFWTLHRWYDDLLILLPMVALYQIATARPTDRGTGRLAAVLLAVTIATTIAPGGLYLLPVPWNTVYVAVQMVTWLAVLVFLWREAHRERADAVQPLPSRRPQPGPADGTGS